MKRNEMDFAIQLAAKEGWNPGLHDAECFYRTDPDGFFIGLLDEKFADSEEIAGAILTGLSKHLPGGEPIFLDVPEVNPAAVRLVERCGLIKVFETARMYTGPLPEIDLEGMFGVTTFELG